MILELDTRKPYDFATSVRDHGWIALLPFNWLDQQRAMQRVERLTSGKVVLLVVIRANCPRVKRRRCDIKMVA